MIALADDPAQIQGVLLLSVGGVRTFRTSLDVVLAHLTRGSLGRPAEGLLKNTTMTETGIADTESRTQPLTRTR